MKITDRQLGILNELKCERLSSDSDNFGLIDRFENLRNERLADALKNSAFSDDENNRIAYYLVKNRNGDVLFYFSLKCGSLYDKYLDEQRMSYMKALILELIQKKQSSETSPEDIGIIDDMLENLRKRKGISKSDLEKLKHKDGDAIKRIEEELENENTKVGATFAGIEIVEFCANDATKEQWKEMFPNNKLGGVVFWHFIVPIVLDVMKLAGCEYICLFAADSTPDETLVNYYRYNMNFISSDERKTTTPFYDLTCKFMFQETSGLKERQQRFYDSFNKDVEAV